MQASANEDAACDAALSLYSLEQNLTSEAWLHPQELLPQGQRDAPVNHPSPHRIAPIGSSSASGTPPQCRAGKPLHSAASWDPLAPSRSCSVESSGRATPTSAAAPAVAASSNSAPAMSSCLPAHLFDAFERDGGVALPPAPRRQVGNASAGGACRNSRARAQRRAARARRSRAVSAPARRRRARPAPQGALIGGGRRGDCRLT